jgi:hypothetical protein
VANCRFIRFFEAKYRSQGLVAADPSLDITLLKQGNSLTFRTISTPAHEEADTTADLVPRNDGGLRSRGARSSDRDFPNRPQIVSFLEVCRVYDPVMAAGPINTEPDCDSSHLLSGTVEVDSRTVPYIDVRAEHVSAALSRVERFVQEVE